MARIAVIGSGISGLAAAHMLGTRHDVTLFEAEPRPGGHARTLRVAGVAVDTGFIVYNTVNYPLLTAYLAHLAVETHMSDMSFGVRVGSGDLEYAASSIAGMFAQPRNLVSPSHWSMLRDILRFFRRARGVLDRDDDPTLGAFVADLRLGNAFRERFLIPMGAAIWSTPPRQMMDFPAKAFVRFFDNHGLLSVNGQHPWRTIAGGSRMYVEAIARHLGERLRLSAPVSRVKEVPGGAEVTLHGGESRVFDQVVFACHADAALRLIADPTDAERSVLGAFTFRDNVATLHGDARLMPKAKAAWASWIYAAGGPDAADRVSVTYWMNRLQALPGPDLFVTLNADRPIAADLIHDTHVFRHPVFCGAAIKAQAAIPELQGRNGRWYCGAWQRNGFHEDGLWSAVRVARGMGADIPWA